MKLTEYVKDKHIAKSKTAKIFEICKTNPHSSQEVADLMGIPERTAHYHMEYLKKRGKIRLIHYWEVVPCCNEG
jgi:predicted ArsR family transcriptional regulator